MPDFPPERQTIRSLPPNAELRFLLGFRMATGLRAGEPAATTLRLIESDPSGLRWLRVTGNGTKVGKGALPPLAWNALMTYLLARQLPTHFPRTLESR